MQSRRIGNIDVTSDVSAALPYQGECCIRHAFAYAKGDRYDQDVRVVEPPADVAMLGSRCEQGSAWRAEFQGALGQWG